MEKFSVLLSVYYKENPEYLKKSIKSIYNEQILKPDEIILIEDGALTEELDKIIDELQKEIPILKIKKLEKNMGLGVALNKGVLLCSNEWIARMDTDDIAHPMRFLKQIEYIENHPETDILGTFMGEFIESINNIICIKKAPLTNIKNYIKYRDPVNHPTVFLKKSKVLEAGNYQQILLNEDSYLWRRMLVKGAIIKNIPEILLYFRVSDDTYQRRGGWKYVKAEWKLQKKYKELKIINFLEFWINIFLKAFVRMAPNKLRKMIYLKILRDKNISEIWRDK